MSDAVKVRELIEKLKTFDPELEVWISRDEEGNGFNPLAWDFGKYLFDPEEKSPVDEECSDCYGLDRSDFPTVVILWP